MSAAYFLISIGIILRTVYTMFKHPEVLARWKREKQMQNDSITASNLLMFDIKSPLDKSYAILLDYMSRIPESEQLIIQDF